MGCADLVSTYAGLRQAAAWRLVTRDGVIISGDGARAWLQGQLSQDVSALGDQVGSLETLVLSPQGKIDSYGRVTRIDDGRFLLDVSPGHGPVLLDRLRRFKLRVKAELELVEDLHVAELRGPGLPASAGLAPAGTGLQRLAVIEVDWPGWSGRDVVFAGEVAGLDGSALGLGDVSAGADEAFEAAQIEAGVPKLGSELTDRTIPQEAGDLVAHAVSFTKGCYTGQELVARIDARGSNTPRRLRGLVIEGGQSDPAPAAGDAVVSADGVQVGDVTRAAWSPGQQAWVALGYVKRGTEVPAPVSVTSGGDGAAVRGSRSATVRSLPLFEALVA